MPSLDAVTTAPRRMVARIAAARGWRADLIALALGMLSAAALPPLYVVPVLLIAVPGLLALIDGAPGIAVAARRGFWFGLGHHLFGLYWITEAILIEAARFWWLVPLAVPALSAVLALFIAAAVGTARAARAGWPRALTLAGAWVLADLARQFVATGFPWNPWGSVWEFQGIAGDVFIQPASWVGVHGLTFATVLLAAAPALGARACAAAAVIVLAWAGAGAWRLSAPLPPAPAIPIVLTQGNVSQGQKWDRALMLDIFQRYLALTRAGVAEAGTGPKVVVWPETASPFLLTEDTAARAAIARAAGPDAVTLAGTVRFDAAGRPRNTLLTVLPDGDGAGMYDKWHLVPFGEYQPDWFPLPIQVVPGGGFARGDGPRTLALPGLPAPGALICYEAIYSGELVDESHRPAWLVNVTNDAWFGNSSGPRQHLAGVRMRAVEEGLPVLRAANTGITAAFDPRGHEIARLERNRQGVMVVPLPPSLPPTLFSQFGLWIPGTLAGAACLLGLANRRRPGRGSHRLQTH